MNNSKIQFRVTTTAMILLLCNVLGFAQRVERYRPDLSLSSEMRWHNLNSLSSIESIPTTSLVRRDLRMYDNVARVSQLDANGPDVTGTTRSYVGDRDKVLAIQHALKDAGFNPGRLDGQWGAQTRAAVIDFQNSHGLTADGIVGKETAAALDIEF